MSEKVSIELTKEEAIILFEYLARTSDNSFLEKTFEDKSEQRVLWNLEAILESILAEPLMSDYEEIVRRARKNIMDKIED
jgi:hypothetical protein